MFNLTFKQSEKVTKDLINNFVVNLKGKKHVTFGYTFKHFMGIFLFWCLISFEICLPLSFIKESKLIITLLKYLLSAMFFLLLLSVIMYSVFFITKNICYEQMFSFALLYIDIFAAAMALVIMANNIIFSIKGFLFFVVCVFYSLIFIWTFVNIYHSYSIFKKTLGVEQSQTDINISRVNKVIAKYGGSIFCLCMIINLIKRIFFENSSLSHTMEYYSIIAILMPLMIFAVSYFLFYRFPTRYILPNYYFLKYKKEYQKKILDEYQIDFCGWEKHKKK